MKSYRGRLPKPDELGRWRPVVGRQQNGKPQRFQVGNRRDTPEGEALRRLNHIRDLYDHQCTEYGIDYWSGWALPWAKKLEQQIPVRVYASDAARCREGSAAEELAVIYKLQSWGLPIQIADPDFHAAGYSFLKKAVEAEVAKAVEKVLQSEGLSWGPEAIQKVQERLPENWAAVEQRTFHDAIDAYKAHRQATSKQDKGGSITTSTRKSLRQLDYLKQHHANMPLWQLDLPALQTMGAYWRNRPDTRKGKRCSWDHAHAMLKELFRLLNWLDEHPSYKWTKPKGAENISRSPIKLPTDDRNHNEAFRTITKDTFSIEQLAIIADNVDDFGKILVAVCVNCAFGASEVGQWPTNLFTLHKTHPRTRKFNLTPRTKIHG